MTRAQTRLRLTLYGASTSRSLKSSRQVQRPRQKLRASRLRRRRSSWGGAAQGAMLRLRRLPLSPSLPSLRSSTSVAVAQPVVARSHCAAEKVSLESLRVEQLRPLRAVEGRNRRRVQGHHLPLLLSSSLPQAEAVGRGALQGRRVRVPWPQQSQCCKGRLGERAGRLRMAATLGGGHAGALVPLLLQELPQEHHPRDPRPVGSKGRGCGLQLGKARQGGRAAHGQREGGAAEEKGDSRGQVGKARRHPLQTRSLLKHSSSPRAPMRLLPRLLQRHAPVDLAHGAPPSRSPTP